MRLSAVVENRGSQTPALPPRDVTLEVYFVSIEEFNRWIVINCRQPSNVYANIDSYDRYKISLDEAFIENDVSSGGVWTLAARAEGFVEVAASQEVTSPHFTANNRGDRAHDTEN